MDREEKKEIDAQLLIEHFDKMKEMNASCYGVDDDGKLTHCFWLDSISRKNYHHF